MKNLFLSMMLVFATTAMACDEAGKTGFVEDNDLYIPADSFRKAGLSEEQFNEVITKIETIYKPIAAGMKGDLQIARKWTDGTVNANATRSGSNWKVNMYGGLARHETITEDGFALVLCHEIGHHIGGAPKIAGMFNSWASNEGQSDYFSALKCLRKTFLNDDNSAIVSSMTVPAALTAGCSKTYKNKEDRAMCIRVGMSGDSVAKLFAALRSKPAAKFETPDTTVVTKTDDAHPAYQCRLDTFFQGAMCDVGMNEDVSQKEEVQGTCHGTLGHKIGTRPLCWFKPKVK